MQLRKNAKIAWAFFCIHYFQSGALRISSANPSFLSVNYIDLYDYDEFNSDDLISILGFIPYESSGGFPTTITRTNSDGTFECDIAFEYTW